ncbi:Zinc finger, RING-type [Phaffia rhodozyma]|uniref:Zinc finger, RING-type n=1 Tax=Phaffia rhodozyma TaxID=264483 RepID=A0A0F7SHE3_PHARH|nr:Zinc finger, RING-type [Phaffia rhodozyma]
MSANDYIRSLLSNADLPARPPPRNSRGLRADSSHPSPYTSNDHLYHGQTTLRPPPNMTRVRASRSNQRSPDNSPSETATGGAGFSSNPRNTPSPSFSTRNGSSVGNGGTQPRRKKRPRPPTRLQSREDSVGSSSGTQTGMAVGNAPATSRPGSAGTGTRPVASRVRNDEVASARQSSGTTSQTERRVDPAVMIGLRTRRMSVGTPLQAGPVDFSRGASMRRRNVQEDLNPVNDQRDDSDLTPALPPPSYLDTISPNTASRRVPIGPFPASDPPAPDFTAIFDVPPPPILPQTPPQSQNSLTVDTLSTPPRGSVLAEPPTPSFPGAFPASPIRVISHSIANAPVDNQSSLSGTAVSITTNIPSSPPPSFELSRAQAQDMQQSLVPFSSPIAVSQLRIVSNNEQTTVERPSTPPSPQCLDAIGNRTLWDRLADEGLSIEERLIIIGSSTTESLEGGPRHDTEASREDGGSTSEAVVSGSTEFGVADRAESIHRSFTSSHSTVNHLHTAEFLPNSVAAVTDTSEIETALPSTLAPYLHILHSELGAQECSGSVPPEDDLSPLREDALFVMAQNQADEIIPNILLSSTVEPVDTTNLLINDNFIQPSTGFLDPRTTPANVSSVNLSSSYHHYPNQIGSVSETISSVPPPIVPLTERDLHDSSSTPSSSSPSLASSSDFDLDQLDCQSSSSDNLGASSQDSSRSPSPSIPPTRSHEQDRSPRVGERGGRATPELRSSSLSSLSSPSSSTSGGIEMSHFGDDQSSSHQLMERFPLPVPPPLQPRPQRRPPPPAPPPQIPRWTSLYTSPAIASSSTSLARLANPSSTSLPTSAPLASTYRRPPPPPPPARPSIIQRHISPSVPPPSSRAHDQITRTTSPPPPPLPPRPRPPSAPVRSGSADGLSLPLLRPTLQERALSGLSSLSSTSSEVSLDPSRRPSWRSDLCVQNERNPDVSEELNARIQEPMEVSDLRGGSRGGREIGSLSSPERAEVRVRPRGPRSLASRSIASNLGDAAELPHRQIPEVIPAESEEQRNEDQREEDGHVDDPAEEIRGDERRQSLPELEQEPLQTQAPVEFEYTDLDLLVMSLDGSQQYEAATALTSFLGPAHPKGLTTAQVDALPHGQVVELSRRTTSKGKTKVKLSCPAVGARRVGRCSFGCLGTLKAGEWIVGLVICEHVGCEPCARSWLKEDASCPVCRKKVVA